LHLTTDHHRLLLHLTTDHHSLLLQLTTEYYRLLLQLTTVLLLLYFDVHVRIFVALGCAGVGEPSFQ
jgi:hypothetical protein